MADVILVITETLYMLGFEGELEIYKCNEFRIDTSKIAEFKKIKRFEYGYVQNTIEDALNGKLHQTSSRKYSFGDCDTWYADLIADSNCTFPEIIVEVEILL